MKKNYRRVSSILILLISILLLISTIPGLDFLMDLALTLFIPFAIFSGRATNNHSVAYGYLSLALMLLLFLMTKQLV